MILIIHNVRSAHNVGSLLRSANGLGIAKVHITGYSPYPKISSDSRLPHESIKATAQISKTSLGAEKSLEIIQTNDILDVIANLKKSGCLVVALEQSKNSVPLNKVATIEKMALIVGNEVDGLDKYTLRACDLVTEIPMKGDKESFNVAVAGAIALYALTSGRNDKKVYNKAYGSKNKNK